MSLKDKKLRPVDFAEKTTFHGCTNIFDSDSKCHKRFVWLLLFGSFFMYCSFNAFDRIAYYRTLPHTTSIDEVDLSPEPSPKESSLDKNILLGNRGFNKSILEGLKRKTQNSKLIVFPAVTICNLNVYKSQDLTAEDWFQTAHKLFDIVDDKGNFRKADTLSKYFRPSAAKNLLAGVNKIRENSGFNEMVAKKRRKKRQLNSSIVSVGRKIKKFVEPEFSDVEVVIPKHKDNESFLPQHKKSKVWNMVDFVNRTSNDIDMILSCSYRGIDCTERFFWKQVDKLTMKILTRILKKLL